MNNGYNTTKKVLTLLKVRHTKAFLKDAVMAHKDHNSLLAISDALFKYKIENTGVKIDKNRFNEIPRYSILQINKDGRNLFYILESISGEKVAFYNENKKLQILSRQVFINLWTGVCLLVEANENSQEPGIESKLGLKRTLKIITFLFLTLIISWLIINYSVTISLATIFYTGLKFAGLVVTIFLLWYDIDKFNPILQNFCSRNKKVNCNAVLTSKHAKVFNLDLFSLSILGFSYFFASLVFLFFQSFSQNSLVLISLISIVTVPIVFLSIYYQAFVIKQWCRFCIIIQLVLVLESITVFFSQSYNYDFYYFDFLLFTALFLIPILAWYYLKPLLEKEKEVLFYKRTLKKVKNNPTVFNSLLAKSNTIKNSTEGMGIIFTKKDAKINIVKVCNPYCGPCAKAHPILEKLLKSGKINLQILFTAKDNINDVRVKPVNHFLSLDSSNDKEVTQKALDDWYLSKDKNYEDFAKKYPVNDNFVEQKEKIKAMSIWCKEQKITHTPTIFVNNYELPKQYSLEDLNEILA